MPGLTPDLDLFLEFHGQHAPFKVAASEQTAHGYWLRVRCPCGVLFERYVTAADAEVDLITGALGRLDQAQG